MESGSDTTGLQKAQSQIEALKTVPERPQESPPETPQAVPQDAVREPASDPAPVQTEGADEQDIQKQERPDEEEAVRSPSGQQPPGKQTKKEKKQKKQKRENDNAPESDGESERPRSIVCLQDVNSSEFGINHTGAMSPLLRDISVEIFRGEIWGIGAGTAYESEVLCQIIGNMRPYYSGYCRIGPIGTMRKKKRILSHLFYIDAPNLMLSGMTVLEQLMISTKNNEEVKDSVQRQKMMLEFLVEAGLSHIALSRDEALMETERLLIQLIAAVFSESGLIVCNFVPFSFSQNEIQTLKRINEYAREKEKAIIIATMQPKLIGMACSHVLFIRHGKVGYGGAVEQMIREADNVFCMLTDQDAPVMAERLERLLPGFHCEVSGEQIFLHNVAGVEWDRAALYQLLAEHEIFPEQVKINRGRAENSFVELMRRYDL